MSSFKLLLFFLFSSYLSFVTVMICLNKLNYKKSRELEFLPTKETFREGIQKCRNSTNNVLFLGRSTLAYQANNNAYITSTGSIFEIIAHAFSQQTSGPCLIFAISTNLNTAKEVELIMEQIRLNKIKINKIVFENLNYFEDFSGQGLYFSFFGFLSDAFLSSVKTTTSCRNPSYLSLDKLSFYEIDKVIEKIQENERLNEQDAATILKYLRPDVPNELLEELGPIFVRFPPRYKNQFEYQVRNQRTFCGETLNHRWLDIFSSTSYFGALNIFGNLKEFEYMYGPILKDVTFVLIPHFPKSFEANEVSLFVKLFNIKTKIEIVSRQIPDSEKLSTGLLDYLPDGLHYTEEIAKDIAEMLLLSISKSDSQI